MSNSLILLLLACGGPGVAQAEPAQCTFQTYQWNVELRQAVGHRTVQHPYAALHAAQRDAATGCTVCDEDQVWVVLEGVAPFRLCRYIAPVVKAILKQAQAEGFPLYEVTGYRVGLTRGEPDADGNRTGFSNHSFGIAVDINPQLNGLYDRCIEFDPGCRLLRGGSWQPHAAGGLHAAHPLVQALRAAGFEWGGEIRGRQKDFMHFSPSGY